MDITSQSEPPLLDHPLIPLPDFVKKLKAIMSVPKTELDERIAANPLPPQKRGPKTKSTERK